MPKHFEQNRPFVIRVEAPEEHPGKSWWFDVSEKGAAKPMKPIKSDPKPHETAYAYNPEVDVPKVIEDYLMEELGCDVVRETE